jgi:hypothetical protein
MEFFSIGTLVASLTEAHIAKFDLRHTDSRQQRAVLPWAALASLARHFDVWAGENSTGLMGSGRVRRHPHRRN